MSAEAKSVMYLGPIELAEYHGEIIRSAEMRQREHVALVDPPDSHWAFAAKYHAWLVERDDNSDEAEKLLKDVLVLSQKHFMGVGPEGELTTQQSQELVREYPARKCVLLEEWLEDAACRYRACVIAIQKRSSGRAPEFLRREVGKIKAKMKEWLKKHQEFQMMAPHQIAPLVLEEVLGQATRSMEHSLRRAADGSLFSPPEPTLYAKRKLVAWAHTVIGCKEEHSKLIRNMESTLRQYHWEISGLEKHRSSLCSEASSPKWREHLGDIAFVERRVEFLRQERGRALDVFSRSLKENAGIGHDDGTFLWVESRSQDLEADCDSDGMSEDSLVSEGEDDSDNPGDGGIPIPNVSFDIGRGFSY